MAKQIEGDSAAGLAVLSARLADRADVHHRDHPVAGHILDEATANVDPENEDRLQKAIEALTHGKTILMIAHRLKTVRSADQILVLDGDKIVQQGRHDELIKQPGLYAEFVGGRKETADWKL